MKKVRKPSAADLLTTQVSRSNRHASSPDIHSQLVAKFVMCKDTEAEIDSLNNRLRILKNRLTSYRAESAGLSAILDSRS